MNTFDWSEITSEAKSKVTASIKKVRDNRKRVWNVLTSKDFEVLDEAEKGVECGCQEVTDKQKLVLRAALDISVKMEIAEQEEYKAKKINHELQISGIAKEDLQ